MLVTLTETPWQILLCVCIFLIYLVIVKIAVADPVGLALARPGTLWVKGGLGGPAVVIQLA